MVVPLPRYVAITTPSRKKFLRPSGSTSLLKFDDVDLLSWGVKHEVVNSKAHPGRVHFKCVDSGKYWSWGLDKPSKNYIAAQSKKTETDTSSNACTLVNYSQHTTNGVSSFKLKFRWKSEWHVLHQESGGFLMSGERKGGETFTNFVIEDWEHLARENQKKKAAGGGGASTSAGKAAATNVNISFGKLKINQ